MRLSFQVEVQPTPTQRQALLQHAGNARWAYNWGLAQYKAAYTKWVELEKPKKWNGWPNAIGLHRDLNVLKGVPQEEGGVPWMYEASKAAPQETLRNLDVAFKNFFTGRGRYPRFKSRSRGIGGFRLTGVIRADQKTIKLPTIGRLRVKPGERGYLPFGKHAQVSVTERAGRWFVSVVGPEITEAAPNGLPVVGIDLGVAHLATLSDGTVFANPRALAAGQKKIRRVQKEVSRRQKGSANRGKSRKRLAWVHARVRNVRQDVLHKATTTIAKSHGKVIIENLKVRNMTRSARGTVAAPGRKVRQKAGLNRVLLDASFAEFRRMLEYKGKRFGCEVVAVNPAYTSQRCSACGHVESGNRASQAGFRCLSCSFEINADLNAAINIMVAGSCPETENACGEDVRPGQLRLTRRTSMKQESAGARGP